MPNTQIVAKEATLHREAPKSPPKSWWQKITDKIRKSNPKYTPEQVDSTAGSIWYHKMGPAKKKEETKKSEGSLRVNATDDIEQLTKDDWEHIIETAKSQRTEWNVEMEAELPEEAIMTSIGYVNVGLLSENTGFVSGYGMSKDFEIDNPPVGSDAEESEEFEPDEEDAFIDASARGSEYAVSAGGKLLGNSKDYAMAEQMIREWGNKNQFWPNVWHVSDHGNVTLVENFQWDAVPAKTEASLRVVAANPIVTGMAQAFWATTWANKMEETGHSEALMSTEITDIMPEVPQRAYMLAEELKKEIDAANHIDLDTFIPPGFSGEQMELPEEGKEQTDGSSWSSSDAESFGWYLAMQAMGHGVSWRDDHEDHGLTMPHFDKAYELEDDAEDAIDDEYGVGKRPIDGSLHVEAQSLEDALDVKDAIDTLKDQAARLLDDAKGLEDAWKEQDWHFLLNYLGKDKYREIIDISGKGTKRVQAQEQGAPADASLFNPEDIELFIGEVKDQAQSLIDISMALEEAAARNDWETIKQYMESGMIPGTQPAAISSEPISSAPAIAASLRVQAVKERVIAAQARFEAAKMRVEGQKDLAFMFPNLFSSEAKRWIETETKRRAADKARTSASPEQTLAFIDQAAKEVGEQLAQAVSGEIASIISDDTRQKIYDEIAVPQEEILPAAPQIPIGPTVPPPGPAVAPAPVEASTKEVHMPHALRVAFDRAADFMEPQIVEDDWVMIDGPAGTEWIQDEFVDVAEVQQLIASLESGQQIELKATSLGQYTENDKAWDIDLRHGFGARMSAPGYMDATSWTVFDTEAEAKEYLASEMEEETGMEEEQLPTEEALPTKEGH